MGKKATNSGSLNPIDDCWIRIPQAGKITLNNLPEISDTKSAVYNSDPIMGRAAPLYTYSHSGDRSISMQLHFFIVDQGDADRNLQYLRWIESATYPREGNGSAPYTPPVICQLRCGDLLASGNPVCAILQSYNVAFPTDVAWDTNDITFCPFRLDVTTNWTVVYTTSNLPFNTRIIDSGY